MPDTPSLTLVHFMTYKGRDEEWSNKFHFSGTTPASDAGWKDLADAISASLYGGMGQGMQLRRAYGHNAGDEFAVWQGTVQDATLTARSGGMSEGNRGPGDATVWVRWKTPQRTSKGKVIYLRKYLHGVRTKTSDPDGVADSQRTALATFAGKMIDGTLPGGAKICGPQGAVASSPLVSPTVGFRQLKRTGKRPS